MDWVPEYVRDVTVADHHLKGYVSSKRELKELIEIHSRWFNCEFVYWDNDQSKKEKTTRKLMWSYKHVGVLHSEESQDQIHPFVVSNYTVNACQYGKPHYRKPAEKEPKDHIYVKNKKFHSQNTRKIDCPAKLSYRKVTSLASFYMDEVCLKEGLAAILEKVLGMDYNEADNACRQTESNSLLKSMEMAKKLCNQITCMDTMAKKASDSKRKAAESPEMDKTFPRLRRRASLPDLQDSFKSHPSI